MGEYKRTLDVDVDENGQPVKSNEPQVSAKTGKRRKGKPRTMDERKIKKAIELIKNGSYVKPAIQSVGLNYHTHLNWWNNGKKGIKPYDEYYERIEKAKAQSETDIVEMLHESIESGNTGVAMWMLSRKFPKRWEKTERVEAKIDNSQQIEIIKFSDKREKEEKEE